MHTITTWVLLKDNFTEDDILWCKGLDVKVDIEPLYRTIHVSGATKQYCTGVHIELQTHCEKQETMLQLKYSEQLIKKNVSVRIPHNNV